VFLKRQNNARLRGPTKIRGNLGDQHSLPPSNTAWRLTPRPPPFLAFHFPTKRTYSSSSSACTQSLPIEAPFGPMSHEQRCLATSRESCHQNCPREESIAILDKVVCCLFLWCYCSNVLVGDFAQNLGYECHLCLGCREIVNKCSIWRAYCMRTHQHV
jgi:hypothetical protein